MHRVLRPFMIAWTCLYLSITAAQPVKVESCKNAIYTKGGKVRKGQRFDPSKEIQIRADGELGMTIGRWCTHLGPGNYNIALVVDSLKKRREYILDDSIFSVLSKNKLLNCNPGIQCRGRGPSGTSNHDPTIRTRADSVTLSWESFHGPFVRKYYVVILNVFDEYLGLLQTEQKEITLHFTGLMKKEKNLVYKVISEDCFQSDAMLIVIE